MSAYDEKIPLKTFRHDAVRATVYETPMISGGVSYSVGFTSGFRDDGTFDGIELLSVAKVAVRAETFIQNAFKRQKKELLAEEKV